MGVWADAGSDQIFSQYCVQLLVTVLQTEMSLIPLSLQADLLALPLPGQQRQRLRLRLLLLPHTSHAGHQPLLRVLVDGTRRRL